MRKLYKLLVLFFCCPAVYAQLSTSNGTIAAEGTANMVLLTGTNPRVTILSATGAVGIGTSSPTTALHVNGNIRSTNGDFSSAENSNLTFFTGATRQMTVLSNGNVGIGTDAPQEKLQVEGNILSQRAMMSTGIFGSTGTSNLSLQTNGTTRLTILSANGNVGIGITPTEKLQVDGTILGNEVSSYTGTYNTDNNANLLFKTDGTNRLTVLNTNGYVGIGTQTPEQLMHVEGGNIVVNNGATPAIFTGSGSGELNHYLQITNSSTTKTPSGLKTGGLLVSDDFAYSSPSKNDLVVKGHVGIGTPLSSNLKGYALAVNGKIAARDLLVETTSGTWPDYVFSSQYHLPSLYEVEKYVKENKHLEDVPSAQQIEEKHSVGEMDAILLKKVEELTLYIIQQQKQIDALQKRLDEKE